MFKSWVTIIPRGTWWSILTALLLLVIISAGACVFLAYSQHLWLFVVWSFCLISAVYDLMSWWSISRDFRYEVIAIDDGFTKEGDNVVSFHTKRLGHSLDMPRKPGGES